MNNNNELNKQKKFKIEKFIKCKRSNCLIISAIYLFPNDDDQSTLINITHIEILLFCNYTSLHVIIGLLLFTKLLFELIAFFSISRASL